MADDDLYDLKYIYEAGKILNENSKISVVDCFLTFDHNIKKYINDLDALKYLQIRKNKFKIKGSNYFKRINFVEDNLIYNKEFIPQSQGQDYIKKLYILLLNTKKIYVHFTDQLFYLFFLIYE